MPFPSMMAPTPSPKDGAGLCRSGSRRLQPQARPVVIVQHHRFDATASVTVCPLTTNPVRAPLTRIPVEATAATGIDQPSSIMVDKISTMPRIAVRDVLVVSRTPTRFGWTARSWSFSGWRNDSASLISLMHRPLTDCSGHRAASRFQ